MPPLARDRRQVRLLDVRDERLAGQVDERVGRVEGLQQRARVVVEHVGHVAGGEAGLDEVVALGATGVRLDLDRHVRVERRVGVDQALEPRLRHVVVVDEVGQRDRLRRLARARFRRGGLARRGGVVAAVLAAGGADAPPNPPEHAETASAASRPSAPARVAVVAMVLLLRRRPSDARGRASRALVGDPAGCHDLRSAADAACRGLTCSCAKLPFVRRRGRDRRGRLRCRAVSRPGHVLAVRARAHAEHRPEPPRELRRVRPADRRADGRDRLVGRRRAVPAARSARQRAR